MSIWYSHSSDSVWRERRPILEEEREARERYETIFVLVGWGRSMTTSRENGEGYAEEGESWNREPDLRAPFPSREGRLTSVSSSTEIWWLVYFWSLFLGWWLCSIPLPVWHCVTLWKATWRESDSSTFPHLTSICIDTSRRMKAVWQYSLMQRSMIFVFWREMTQKL